MDATYEKPAQELNDAVNLSCMLHKNAIKDTVLCSLSLGVLNNAIVLLC